MCAVSSTLSLRSSWAKLRYAPRIAQRATYTLPLDVLAPLGRNLYVTRYRNRAEILQIGAEVARDVLSRISR